MGLPSLKLDSTALQGWQNSLREAGYAVTEETPQNGCSHVERQTGERVFLVQRSDSWIRLLEFRKDQTGQAGLVAGVHQQGSSSDWANRIFAHLNGAFSGQGSQAAN